MEHVSSALLKIYFLTWSITSWQSIHCHTKALQRHCQFGLYPEEPTKLKSPCQNAVTCSLLSGNPRPPHHTDQVGEFQTPGPLFVEAQGKIFRLLSSSNYNLNFNSYN